MEKRTAEGIRTMNLDGYKTAGRDYNPPERVDDMTEVISMGLDSIKGNRGRQATYPNNNEGLEKFYNRAIAYFQRINTINGLTNADSGRVAPDYEGLAIWCGISRMTLLNYEKRGGAWTEMIQLLKTLITAARKQLTTSYKVPPMWEIFNLVNNSMGYQNTNQIVINAETSKAIREEQELELELDTKGLVWDEESGEYIPKQEGERYE